VLVKRRELQERNRRRTPNWVRTGEIRKRRRPASHNNADCFNNNKKNSRATKTCYFELKY
jgi:hypothetical protein